ncbi:hypothetical protein D3C77_293630 [compost metagenome]
MEIYKQLHARSFNPLRHFYGMRLVIVAIRLHRIIPDSQTNIVYAVILQNLQQILLYSAFVILDPNILQGLQRGNIHAFDKFTWIRRLFFRNFHELDIVKTTPITNWCRHIKADCNFSANHLDVPNDVLAPTAPARIDNCRSLCR